MNENNATALIQTVYAAFSRGDIRTILDHLAPDVQWTMEGPAVIPFAGKRSGPAEVGRFFEALATTLDNQSLTTDEYIAQGNNVAAVGRYAATVKATGKHIDTPIVHIFAVKDGQITRFIGFFDTAQVADAYTARKATSSAA